MDGESRGWLAKYLGCEIEVLYLVQSGAYKDRGILTDFGDQWIELAKGSGGLPHWDHELFLIPINAIRLAKVVGRHDKEADRLLRPVAANPEPFPNHKQEHETEATVNKS